MELKPASTPALQPFRWWEAFSRSLLHLYLRGPDGARQTWSVDVRHGGDTDGEVYAHFYRDGLHMARLKPPVLFPLPVGTIRIAVSTYGLRQADYVTHDGAVQPLVPDASSAEGLRAHLDRTRPGLSRLIGAASALVLLVSLALGVPQLLQSVTEFPPLAENIGTFASPILLPAWANTSLLLAGLAASTERALRLRYNWLLDGGLFSGGD
ncbi:hypothetical protein [Arthrobacter sp. Edens01]|uniref:hypothetical protein n=1 Tax=Arthrobacter sp. Edens01 TaxID=1732020 RepID=UPI0006DAEAB1|nr:hypothetical protein [Arthrobacter sp. Edens01]KPN18992.1 hypothetical protein AO716_14690 [Arthrobacter sp. Edens01]